MKIKSLFLLLLLTVCLALPLEAQAQENAQPDSAKKNPAVQPDAGESSQASPQDKDQPDQEKQAKPKQEDDDSGEKPKTEKPKSDEDSASKGGSSSSGNRSRNGFSSRKKSSKRADQFVDVFDPVVASMENATVRINSGDEQIALGTVIDSEGLILTKASELRAAMTCDINGEAITPKVIGIHPETDLALLKVDAKSLNTVQWSEDPTPPLGRWVATPKAEKDEPAIGIISVVGAREIKPSSPFIGIEMVTTEEKQVRITKIINKSPAELAGLQVNDLIVEVEGEPIQDQVQLIQEVKKFEVGDRIRVKVIRFREDLELKLTLAERDKISPNAARSNQQNSMGSLLSARRRDFPKAFQHDSMLNRNTCGGPIVDLSGKAIGINIARDGRVSSLALPVETVLPVIELLKSGQLSPAMVNKAKIESIQTELATIETELEPLPEKKSVLSNRYNAERARRDELNKTIQELEEQMQKMISELETRKGEVDEKLKNYKVQLDDVRRRLRSGERVREKLKEELEQLKTGSSR